MIISEQWLRDWVSTDLGAQEIADCLTNAGLEVDGLQSLAGSVDNLVVGRVLEVTKHPDADRLNLTKVDIGTEVLSIVCGAANVREELLVAVATIGAKLPNGLKIKKAKVRGVESSGMLCSASELGLEENSSGLIELDADAQIGERIDQYLQLDDTLIDIDLTPNRGDCLSVQGVARELNVLANGNYHPLDIDDVPATSETSINVDVQAPNACPSYLARVISGLETDATSPIWLQERLRRSGIRPISPVVDITNYVMLELGQPMHAFDLSKLDEKIIVRQAVAGETIKLLDDNVATLDAETLVIADNKGAIAIAGVMGGADSAINDQSTSIVLEAAHFTRKAAAGCARRYGLHTESSHRFERGVDPQMVSRAMHRASELVLAICGGQAGPIIQSNESEELGLKPAVEIRFLRLQKLLGMTLDEQEVGEILGRISHAVTKSEQGWLVTPPSYRFDIVCEADLIEEVARVKGYENIPTAIPRIAPRSKTASEARISVRQVRQALLARDFNEAITYSFISPEAQQQFSPEEPVVLSNPLAENMSVMRTSLLPGLLTALQFNHNRQHDRIRLFEIGASYHMAGDGFTEVQRLAGVITGPLQQSQWGIDKARNVDFYDLKADLQAVLDLTGLKEAPIFNSHEHIALHPGQVSGVQYNISDDSGKKSIVDIGYIGRLHPSLQKQYGLSSNVYVFELDLSLALTAQLPVYKSVSKFPSIKRDLSVVVPQDLAVADVLSVLSSKLGKTLRHSMVFDVYQGEGVEQGKKSVSLSLVLQHNDRTMTDDEAESAVQIALQTLENEFSAQLRN